MSNETNGANGVNNQAGDDEANAVEGHGANPETATVNESPCEPMLSVDELRQALATAQAEAADFKDQYLRAKAEAENIRRRADQARINERKYAYEGFARELLEVRDSLDHAGNVDVPADMTPEHSAALTKLREGVALTVKQMDTVFEKFKVEVVDPAPGEKFDPECHQATGMQPAEGIAANHIVTAFRKGYRLHDRLLRPAMVVVATGSASGGQAGNGSQQPQGGEGAADQNQSNT